MNVCELAKYAEIVGRGITPAYTEEGGLLVLNQKCVRDGRVTLSLARKHDVRARSVAPVKLLQAGDIVVNSTGVGTLGRSAIWREEAPATADSHLTIVRPVSANPVWLSYAMILAEPEIVAMAKGSTGQTELGREQLGRLGVPKLPRREQDAIAEVLGALDDKIAANRRVIDTADNLLAIRSSMLRADAPNTKPLGELVRFNYGKALPAAVREPGDVAVVGSGGVVGSHNVSLVDGPAVVLGRKGSVGATYWIDGPAYAIDTTYWVEPLGVSLYYAYYLLRSIDFASMSTDSAVPGLNRSRAYALDVAMPNTEELARFDRFAGPVTASMGAAKAANETLAKTRDELLPLLMSGKITVRNAEKRVGGVV